MTLSPPESSCVTVHTYCTFSLLINTLHAPLLSIFVEILFCKAKGSGPLSLTTGLVERIWCFHCCNPAQSLVGNLRPTSRHCRPRPLEITTSTLHEPRLSHNTLVCSTLSYFMATHCSILAWEIPLTEKPGGPCMLRGGKELNRTEHAHTNKKVSISRDKQKLHRYHLYLYISINGEGNGNPLQYSCLENPMDQGAWWAAVHAVAKSQT